MNVTHTRSPNVDLDFSYKKYRAFWLAFVMLAVSKYVDAIKLVQKSSIWKPAYYFKETEDKMEVFFFLNDLNINYTFVIALFFHPIGSLWQ